MKEEIEEIFRVLKLLDIKATPNNVSIMNGVYTLLKAIHNELEAKEGTGDGGTEADPE